MDEHTQQNELDRRPDETAEQHRARLEAAVTPEAPVQVAVDPGVQGDPGTIYDHAGQAVGYSEEQAERDERDTPRN